MTRSTSQADEQSAKRSSSVAENVGPARHRLEDGRVAEPRRPVERPAGALEAPRPAVRRRERGGPVGVVDRQSRERAEPLALAGGGVDGPRQARQRTPPRRESDVRRREERTHVLPERARLARDALVARRLADEDEPLRRPRAGRVEEVPVARDGVRPLEPAAELAPGVVVEERRRPFPSRQAAFLEPEQVDRVEGARACPRVVEDGDASALARGGRRTHGRPLESGDHVLRRDRPPVERGERVELGERRLGRAVGARVAARVVARGRRLEPPRVPQHRPEEPARRRDRLVLGAELHEGRDRRAAQLLALLLDPRRLGDRAPAQPPFDEVHRALLEPGERRAEEREELAAAAAEPAEAEEREQGAAEGRLAEPGALLDGVWDADRPEHGLERSAPPLDRVAHDSDPLGRRPAAEQREHVPREQLDRPADAGPLEEVQRSVE